jgi:hypothetical protein
MAYHKYMIYPIEHALSTEAPSLHVPFPYANWGSKNGRIEQKSWKKRWGYNTADRTLADHTPYDVILYQLKGGTRHTMYLTASDLIKKETSAGKTWSYKTDITSYATVTSIVNKVVTLSAGAPETDLVADGDYFILSDDFTAAEEPHRVLTYDTGAKGTGDTPDVGDTVTGNASGATGKIKVIPAADSGTWAGGDAAGDLILTTVTGTFVDNEALSFTDGETAVANGTGTATWSSIASSSNAAKTITLDENYPGTTGADWSGSPKTCYIRHIYTMPSNHRWSWCIIDDKLVFTNGNTIVQYWDGGAATYATTLETTPSAAQKAHYCIEYADRLFIADYGSTRNPVQIAWSANGSITDWSSSDAGSAELQGTEDYITGLGKVGPSLIIYRRGSIETWSATGNATSPIYRVNVRRGIGCAAPWSIVEADGTNFFVGRNDFYMMRGQYPEPIGGKVRDKFFDIVEWTEIEKVWGQNCKLRNEIEWIANTSEGKFAFVYNYKLKEWSVNEYRHDICAAGTGAV